MAVGCGQLLMMLLGSWLMLKEADTIPASNQDKNSWESG